MKTIEETVYLPVCEVYETDEYLTARDLVILNWVVLPGWLGNQNKTVTESSILDHCKSKGHPESHTRLSLKKLVRINLLKKETP